MEPRGKPDEVESRPDPGDRKPDLPSAAAVKGKGESRGGSGMKRSSSENATNCTREVENGLDTDQTTVKPWKQRFSFRQPRRQFTQDSQVIMALVLDGSAEHDGHMSEEEKSEGFGTIKPFCAPPH